MCVCVCVSVCVRERVDVVCVWGRWGGGGLVFYAQSTMTVMSGRRDRLTDRDGEVLE